MITKKSAYLTTAILFFFLVLFFHNQITAFMLSIIPEFGRIKPGTFSTHTHLQYHNGIVISFTGIIFFCLIRALEIHLLEKNISSQNILRYCHLALRMMRWAVVIVVGNMALKCFYGTFIPNYSMRYQAIGGLIAIELLILIRYFSTNKNGYPTEKRQ
jgi:hypothetical protein